MSVKISTVMRVLNQLHGEKEVVIVKENRALYSMWINHPENIDPILSDAQKEEFTAQKAIDDQGDKSTDQITAQLMGEVASCEEYHKAAIGVLELIKLGSSITEIKAAYTSFRVLGGTFDPSAPRKGKDEIEGCLSYGADGAITAVVNGKEREFKGASARNNAGYFVSKELKKLQ